MRKPGAAMMAAPVLLGAFIGSVLRRGAAAGVLGMMAGAPVLALLVSIALPPSAGVAVPASVPAPVSADLFVPIGTAHDPATPLTLEFDQPMDAASVAAALTVQPPGDFTIRWDATARVATVIPDGHWRPDTLYRVVVDSTARSQAGGALAGPVRSVVLTAPAGTAGIAPTLATTTAVRLDSSFLIRVDRSVTAAAVRTALRSDPPLRGDLRQEATGAVYRFEPVAPLEAGTTYRVWLEGLTDTTGVPFQAGTPVEVTTVPAPVVRSIRPRTGSRRVARDSKVTIRFSIRMDEARTEDAVHARAGGKPVAGRVKWAADGRTLVFRPTKSLPYGATVTVRVDETARSADGAPLASVKRTKFTVRPRPVVSTSIPTGAAGAASGSWLAVEQYYLKLMNCTRTGGWVTSSGSCSSPGGRDVAALRMNASISANVARPYARLLATRGECNHFIGGNPGDRLRAAGFGGYNWAENIGCRSGNPYSAVLGSHLFFQSERPYNGGHYRNLMNAAFRQVGVGVWVSSGRVRLVVDFYGG